MPKPKGFHSKQSNNLSQGSQSPIRKFLKPSLQPICHVSQQSPMTLQQHIKAKDPICLENLLRYYSENNTNIFKKIDIGFRANHSLFTNDKGSILHYAAAYGNNEVLNVVLKYTTQSNLNELSDHGFAPIAYAAMLNNKEVVASLLAKGADINIKAYNGFTPLMYAISYGQRLIAETLIQNGADIYSVSNDGTTALTLALLQKNVNIINLLVRPGEQHIADQEQKPYPINYKTTTPLTFLNKEQEMLLKKFCVYESKYGTFPLSYSSYEPEFHEGKPVEVYEFTYSMLKPKVMGESSFYQDAENSTS